MDCSLPGSSVHGILQTKVLEWVAIPSLRDLLDPGIELRSPALQADSLPLAPPEKSNIFCGLPRWLSGKESSSQSRRHGFDSRIWKITWRKKWQPTPVFLPVSHGQRSLTGYSPWGCRELDMTEQLNNSNNVFCSS